MAAEVPEQALNLVSTAGELADVCAQFAAARVRFFTQGMDALLGPVAAGGLEKLDLAGEDLGWEGVGVSQAEFATLGDLGFVASAAHTVFVHPTVIHRLPGSAFYYLALAGLGGKAARRIAPVLSQTAAAAAAGRTPRRRVPPAEAAIVNRVIAEILRVPGITRHHLDLLPLLTTGATLDGGWKDRVGRIGALTVACLMAHALAEAVVTVEVGADGTEADYDWNAVAFASPAEQLNLAPPMAIRLHNGCLILFAKRFSKDPDFSVLAADGTVLAAGEVKGGTDPQSAWERLSLALRTFTDIRTKGYRVYTMLFGLTMPLGSVIGDEGRRGILHYLNNPDPTTPFLNTAFNIWRLRSSGAERARLRATLLQLCGL